jgi:hypothetical protein
MIFALRDTPSFVRDSARSIARVGNNAGKNTPSIMAARIAFEEHDDLLDVIQRQELNLELLQ